MTQTIQLIGIGRVPAVPLSEIKAGDRLMWNYGTTCEVVSVVRVAPKTIELTERYEGQGAGVFTRRKRADRLVARVSG